MSETKKKAKKGSAKNGKGSKSAGKGSNGNKGKSKRSKKNGSKTKFKTYVFNEEVIENAYYVCHNIMDVLHTRGFQWPEAQKKKKKGKKR